MTRRRSIALGALGLIAALAASTATAQPRASQAPASASPPAVRNPAPPRAVPPAAPLSLGLIPETELRWIVRLGELVLGELRLSGAGGDSPLLRLDIVSDPAIPLLRYRNRYETLLDAANGRPRLSRSLNASGPELRETEYRFAPGGGRVDFESRVVDGGATRIARSGSLGVSGADLDTLSFLVWLMAGAGGSGKAEAGLVANLSRLPVKVEFKPGREELRLRGEPLSRGAYRIEGSLGGSGLAGVGGAFRLWIDEGPARLPLKASFSILLGEITMELCADAALAAGRP